MGIHPAGWNELSESGWEEENAIRTNWSRISGKSAELWSGGKPANWAGRNRQHRLLKQIHQADMPRRGRALEVPVPTLAIICHKQKYRGPLHIYGKEGNFGGADWFHGGFSYICAQSSHKIKWHKNTNIYVCIHICSYLPRRILLTYTKESPHKKDIMIRATLAFELQVNIFCSPFP